MGFLHDIFLSSKQNAKSTFNNLREEAGPLALWPHNPMAPWPYDPMAPSMRLRVCVHLDVCAPVHTCTCSLVCVGALVLWSELPFLQHLLVQGKEPEGHPLTGASRTAGLHSQYSGRQASQRPWAERGGEGPREARACVRWEQQFCGSTGLGEAGREATLRWAGPEPPASWSWG